MEKTKYVHVRVRLPEWQVKKMEKIMELSKSTKGGYSGYVRGALTRDFKRKGKAIRMAAGMSEGAIDTVSQSAVSAISKVVASGINVEMLRMPNRINAAASGTRQVAWAVLRGIGVTYQEMARYFNRHHATIIYGVREVDKLAKVYPGVRWMMEETRRLSGLNYDKSVEQPEWIEFVPRYHSKKNCRGLKRAIEAQAPMTGSKDPAMTWTDQEKRSRKKLVRSMAVLTSSEGYRTPVRSSPW